MFGQDIAEYIVVESRTIESFQRRVAITRLELFVFGVVNVLVQNHANKDGVVMQRDEP